MQMPFNVSINSNDAVMKMFLLFYKIFALNAFIIFFTGLIVSHCIRLWRISAGSEQSHGDMSRYCYVVLTAGSNDGDDDKPIRILV